MSEHHDSPNFPSTLNPAEAVKASESGQWDRVFQCLGCKLSLKGNTHSEQTPIAEDLQRLQISARNNGDSHQTGGSQLTKVLEAVRHDFWQLAVPLEQDTDNCVQPIAVRDVVTRGVFPSLNIELTKTTECYLAECDESAILKTALKRDDWQTITAILFLLTNCGSDTEESKTAIRLAVENMDWRYFTAVAGTALKMFYFKPHFMVDVLGLDPRTMLLDRANRIDAIRNLVGCDNRNKSLLALIVKTVISWAREACGRNVVQKWIIPLEIIEDFCITTTAIEKYFTHILDQETNTRGDCFHKLGEYAVANRITFLIQFFALGKHFTQSQANRAARVSVEDGDWEVFLACVKAGADVAQYVKGSTVLQTALSLSPFKLKHHHLPHIDLNRKNNEGLILLHTAVEHWRKDESVHGKDNIIMLCKYGADVRIPYPSGEMVMQKILSHPKKEEKKEEIKEICLVCMQTADTRRIQVDWETVSGLGKDLLHVVCETGAFRLIYYLIKMGADPLYHRNNYTLIDTTITTDNLFHEDRMSVLHKLVEYPQIIQDHRYSVLGRNRLKNFPRNLPLDFLIRKLFKEGAHYFWLIKFLGDHNVFITMEYQQVMTQEVLDSLKKQAWDDVICYLKAKAETCAALVTETSL